MDYEYDKIMYFVIINNIWLLMRPPMIKHCTASIEVTKMRKHDMLLMRSPMIKHCTASIEVTKMRKHDMLLFRSPMRKHDMASVEVINAKTLYTASKDYEYENIMYGARINNILPLMRL